MVFASGAERTELIGGQMIYAIFWCARKINLDKTARYVIHLEYGYKQPSRGA